jgi:hypothetical protein
MVQAIVEIIRTSFQTRDFTPMVNLFDDDGVYETPYAFENARVEGIQAIRKRFEQVSASAWNRAVKIGAVKVIATPAGDGTTVFVEFTITGTRVADQKPFDFPSSVAIIRTKHDRIIHYQDYPNVAGIRKAAGLD